MVGGRNFDSDSDPSSVYGPGDGWVSRFVGNKVACGLWRSIRIIFHLMRDGRRREMHGMPAVM